MSKVKLSSKIIPFVLIASFLFTSCDVPDISEFTTQSAAMTAGIRKGIKDTGLRIKTASTKEELFLPDTITGFKERSKEYDELMKPSLKTLDAVDEYLETLNAIAQANKDSEANAKAIVGSVDNIITAASSLISPFSLPGEVVKIATGLVALGEKFRTAREFKKTVNLAADIVEGRYGEKARNKIVDGKKVQTIVVVKLCTDQTEGKFREISSRMAEKFKEINETAGLTIRQKEDRKRVARNTAEVETSALGCGVMDLLKFTIRDLKKINEKVSVVTESDVASDNQDILRFYANMKQNEKLTKKEIFLIERYKIQASVINDRRIGGSKLFEAKEQIKSVLKLLFETNAQLKNDIIAKINGCELTGKCRGMRAFVIYEGVIFENPAFVNLVGAIPDDKFFWGNHAIESFLSNRNSQLLEEQRAFKEKRELNAADFDAVNSELRKIQEERKTLDDALDKSAEALDTWVQTHAKMRLAIETNTKVSIGTFAAKVRELLAIIQPKEA